MSDSMETRCVLLERLNDTIAYLCDVYRTLPDVNVMVYEVWSAKDIFAHLLFWHESFARNVHYLARATVPVPLKGRLRDLNQAGVDSMRSESLEALMERLVTAQQTIASSILAPEIVIIPYRKGSRDYTPEEHLQVVIDHIHKHLRDVLRVCRI